VTKRTARHRALDDWADDEDDLDAFIPDTEDTPRPLLYDSRGEPIDTRTPIGFVMPTED
jgi:hypothetical protein